MGDWLLKPTLLKKVKNEETGKDEKKEVPNLDFSPTFIEVFERGCRYLKEREGVDLKKIILEGPSDLLTTTYHAQPALLISNIAFLEHLRLEEGIEPAPEDLMAGHSLGEWTAYVAAGALTLEEGALAVYWRGRLMREAFSFEEGARPMTAILGLPDDVVIQTCREISREGAIVVAANFNAPGQVVISGHPHAVAEAADLLKSRGGGISNRFDVGGPFHSPLLQQAGEKLEAKLTELGITFKKPSNLIISNFTGKEIAPDGDHLQSLINQLTGSVQWKASMIRAWELGAVQMVSVDVDDVKKTLLGFAEKIFSREVPVQSVDPAIPMQRQALRFPPGVIRTTEFSPSSEIATRRLLLYSNNAPAIAGRVRKLMATGKKEDLQTALLVTRNRYNMAREAGLRQLQPYADLPEVAEAMKYWGLEWPPPVVRDLPIRPIPEEILKAVLEKLGIGTDPRRYWEEIFETLADRNLSPAEPEDLVYYVESRWGESSEKLEEILRNFRRFSTLKQGELDLTSYGPKKAAKKDKKKGIEGWNDVVLFNDYAIEFPHLGALSQGDNS
jgi:[acyl-carrier-protein] S-malonyltransferase